MKEDKKTMSLRFYNNYISEIAVNPNHKYREDLHGRVVENEIYNLVEVDFLIKVNDSKFFIIINCDLFEIRTQDSYIKGVVL